MLRVIDENKIRARRLSLSGIHVCTDRVAGDRRTRTDDCE